MGKSFFNCEGVGKGQIAKLCNNLALSIQMRSIAEAMALGVAGGIDPKILTKIMSKSTSNCWSLEKDHPVPGVDPESPSSNEYQNGFASQMALKDLLLAN